MTNQSVARTSRYKLDSCQQPELDALLIERNA